MAKALDRYLTKIYYDPSLPTGFGTAGKLFAASRGDGKQYNPNQIQAWLRKQETHTLFSQHRDNFERPRVVVPEKFYQFDVDTAHLVKFKKDNDDYAYILVCIDIFTRFTWTVPMKTLKGVEMVSALKVVFAQSKPQIYRSDGGSENTNKLVKAYLDDQNVKRVITLNETKANYAERVIKTLKIKLTKYMYYKQSHRWVDVLQSVTSSYNNSYHSSIRQTPTEALSADNVELWNIQYAPKKRRIPTSSSKIRAPVFKSIYSLEVDDVVRLSKMPHAFTRAYDEQWTHELFIITERTSQQGIPQYSIKAWNNDKIEGLFYEEELEKVNVTDDTVYKVAEKKRKTKKGVKGYNIKWYGWGPQYDTWVPEAYLVDI